jgi:signal transduction histidine kinase
MILRTKLGTIDNEYVEEMSNNISGYATHLSETINDFRNFYKPNKEQVEISLDTLFESVYSIIKISLQKHNVELIKELHSQDETLSYANELKQVILNLIKNAEDILIEREIKTPIITVKTYTKNKRIFLTIKDNAGGIDTSIIDKIFDPYFSTKKKKDGTGLGLYMSKVIVEDHCNGILSVENTQEGAMFCIELGIV